MKKKMILRGMLDLPIGVGIGYVITIVLSLVWADGYYAPCVPELIDIMGNEINAVIFQAVLCGMLGIGFGAGSVIWEIEHWSLALQTLAYFILASFLMMPVAYFSYWMEHSVKGFFRYFGIFALIFAIIWAVECIIGKYHVKNMNASLDKIKSGKKEG